MRKILMLGPMPPLVGGMSAVLETLAKSELAHTNQLKMLDTGKQTSDDAGFLRTKFAHVINLFRFLIELLVFRPDIVHIHTCSGFTFYIDSIYARLALWSGRKYILHVHGGRFLDFLAEQAPVRKKIALATLYKAAKVVALSKQWQSLFETSLGLKNVTTILNGVAIAADDASVRKSSNHILFLGLISKNKGIYDLIEALSEVKADFHLHIAGNPHPDISAEDLVEKLNSYESLKGKYSLEGTVKGAKKNTLLQQCEIFCLPSYVEGLPMSVLEAMSYQHAIVASRVGGLPDLIQHNHNGLLVTPGDIVNIRENLEILLNNRGKKEQLAVAGKETFLNGFSINALVPLYNKMYKDVLTNNKSQRVGGA